MRRHLTLAFAAVLLASCGSLLPVTDTARMPLTAAHAPVLSQNEAIGLSSWALKDPATTRGNPELAARAVAAEDWLAGQSALSPDFAEYQPGTELAWQQFRREVRGGVGIAPGTPSQLVVDRMLAASDALKAGDATLAQAQFQPPAFSLGGAGTLTALAALPPFPSWDWAYTQLRQNENRSTGHCGLSISC